MTTRDSAVRIALVYPELLGTYGDGGNATVLAHRARSREIPAEIVSVPAGEPLPTECDIYLLGGGEDEPQTLAVQGMSVGGHLQTALDRGAVLLAVCAGFQIAGETFPGKLGQSTPGLGLLPVRTRRSMDENQPPPVRAVGDIVVEADPQLRLPTLVGYENHGGRTAPLPGAQGRPLGQVRKGVGNGTPDGAEGWVLGRVFGTYLHGPVLVQNPAFADHLLSLVVGKLDEYEDWRVESALDRLRRARLTALR